MTKPNTLTGYDALMKSSGSFAQIEANDLYDNETAAVPDGEDFMVTENLLRFIHEQMRKELDAAGGKGDAEGVAVWKRRLAALDAFIDEVYVSVRRGFVSAKLAGGDPVATAALSEAVGEPFTELLKLLMSGGDTPPAGRPGPQPSVN